MKYSFKSHYRYINYESLIRETEKAWLIECDNQNIWLPKSMCHHYEKMKMFAIPFWLIENNFKNTEYNNLLNVKKDNTNFKCELEKKYEKQLSKGYQFIEVSKDSLLNYFRKKAFDLSLNYWDEYEDLSLNVIKRGFQNENR